MARFGFGTSQDNAKSRKTVRTLTFDHPCLFERSGRESNPPSQALPIWEVLGLVETWAVAPTWYPRYRAAYIHVVLCRIKAISHT